MNRPTFVAATNNPNKLREIDAILQSIGCTCISQKQAGAEVEAEENAPTLSGNSYIKAKAVFDLCGMPVIADDTGLFVDALDSAPGVHTARYGGVGQDATAGVDRVLAELGDLPMPKRSARFVTVITALFPDGRVVRATGHVEGFIGTERRGDGGFGYDPVFWLFNNVSLAEISAEKKNQISHRARALRKLAFKLRGITKVKGLEIR